MTSTEHVKYTTKANEVKPPLKTYLFDDNRGNFSPKHIAFPALLPSKQKLATRAIRVGSVYSLGEDKYVLYHSYSV